MTSTPIDPLTGVGESETPSESTSWTVAIDCGLPHSGRRTQGHVYAPKVGFFALLDASRSGRYSAEMVQAARSVISHRVTTMPPDRFVRCAFNVQRALRAYADAILAAVRDAVVEQAFQRGARYTPVSAALGLVDPAGGAAVIVSTGDARSFSVNNGGYLAERGVCRRSYRLEPPRASTRAAGLARRYGATHSLSNGPINVPVGPRSGFALTSRAVRRPLGARIELDAKAGTRQLTDFSDEPCSAIVLLGKPDDGAGQV